MSAPAHTETLLNLGDDVHFGSAPPLICPAKKTSEGELVRGVLQMMQGLISCLFYWDQKGQCFCVAKSSGVYVTHLSHTSLHNLLNQFMYAATCLQRVDACVNKIKLVKRCMPTLRAFASFASQWLKVYLHLRFYLSHFDDLIMDFFLFLMGLLLFKLLLLFLVLFCRG